MQFAEMSWRIFFIYFREWLRHENVTFNANGTISYLVKRRCVPIIDPIDPSAKNPFTDIVVTPNMILLGASSVVSKHSTVASYAFKMLAESFKATPFLNLTVQEFLWGYEDPLLSLASNILPAFIHFKKFGIIDRVCQDWWGTRCERFANFLLFCGDSCSMKVTTTLRCICLRALSR